MKYTTTQLIKRARSLADLPNTAFISYDDEVNSLNESFKQVYTKLTESNDDYYVKTATLTIDTNVKTLNDIYTVALPADFFQLRNVSYNTNGKWQSMDKFNIRGTNYTISKPQYRIQNNNLLIKQSTYYSLTDTLQIDYYPIPQTLSKQESSISYLPNDLDVSVIDSTFTVIDKQGLVDETDYLLYITANTIRVASIAKATDVELLADPTPTVVSNVQYWNGWVFFIQDGDLYKATTDFLTLGTPVLVQAAVTTYCLTGNKVLFDNGLTIDYLDLVDGSTGSTTITVGTTEWALTNNTFRWIEAGLINGTTIPAQKLYTVGDQLYYLVNNNYLYSLDESGDTPVSTLIRSDLFKPQVSGEIVYLFVSSRGIYPVKSLSFREETELSYPNNMFWEVISIQSAIDFKLKQNADTAALQDKLLTVSTALSQSLQRDEYTVARINNYYGSSNAYWSQR